ncbi:UvrD-helicase domain-containing protein [bacterium]|nr:UvrD-helicase domain-containing protein [candidate division CSSED10-310 bacterium]
MELEKLNTEQFEAVKYGDGPLLILAGAGSGKTKVIVNRISYLIDKKQVSPWNILAVTFTNKAANEMRHRVAKILGDRQASQINLGTFHSICLKILRIESKWLHLNRHFSIVDEANQMKRIKKAVNDSGFENQKIEVNSVLSAISKAKNKFWLPEDLANDAEYNVFNRIVSKVFAEYEKGLMEDQALDFDDLIIKTVRLLDTNLEIREKYQEKFKYLLVDEYQDTNHAQYKLLALLADRYRNITVVGDDDQSIYRWRGAEINNILNFSRDFPGAKIVKLEQNYRSTQTILSAASALMQNNRSRTPKKLWTDQGEGERLGVCFFDTDRNEAFSITKKIKALHQSGEWKFGNIAVFYRTNAQSRTLEETFVQEKIPHQVIGHIGFFNRKEIKDITSYIRLVLNPSDSMACRRIVNIPKRGIGRSTQLEILRIASECKIDFFKAMEKTVEDNVFSRFKEDRIIAFIHIIEELIHAARTMNVPDFLTILLQKSGYKSQFEGLEDADAKSSMEIIEEFETAAFQFEMEQKGDLADFADYLALNLNAEDERSGADPDKVSMMTLHSAKGLEFPVVFISGLEEGLCPLFRMDYGFKDEEIEEERRLLYVGMTRAKRNLFLSGALQRFRNGRIQSMEISRFIREIPKKFFTLTTDNAQIPQANYDIVPKVDIEFGSLAKTISHPDAGRKFNKGDRVLHKMYGTGTVLTYQGMGPSAKITVSFDRVGIKRLLVGPARLVLIR